jgi:hypothetical protein
MCNQNCAVLVPIPRFLEPYVYFNPEHPEFGIDEQGRRCLAIDACMVDALQALWDREIPTISACCLHGEGEGVITLPRVVEPGTELPKPNWLQRDEALDRLAASEQEAARLRAESDEWRDTAEARMDLVARMQGHVRRYQDEINHLRAELARWVTAVRSDGLRVCFDCQASGWAEIDHDASCVLALGATTAPEAERAGSPREGAG